MLLRLACFPLLAAYELGELAQLGLHFGTWAMFQSSRVAFP